MMRSMNSAVSSLKNHQTRMDVIGNNIANVNTIAFKSGRVTFKDTYSQMVRTPSGHSDARGGINPGQVGLGMQLSSIDNMMEKGSPDATGKKDDLYIDGPGFFQVKSADGVFYTRDGNFKLDEEGYLTTQDGRFVQGYKADKDGNVVESLGNIQVPLKDILRPNVTSKVNMVGNISAAAGTGFGESLTDEYEKLYGPLSEYEVNGEKKQRANTTLEPQWSNNNSEGKVSPLAKTTNITAYDSIGGRHDIRLDFIKTKNGKGPTEVSEWKVFAFLMKEDGTYVPFDGNTITDDSEGTALGKPIENLSLNFNNLGKIPEETIKNGEAKTKLSITGLKNGAENLNIDVDFSQMTQYESASDAGVQTNDGYELGHLNDVTYGADGKVIGKFDNGSTKVLGQIVTVTFANETGLQKQGDNLWTPTANSGDPNIGKPGQGENGIIVAGTLESSNVDLAKEFTNMIITQRGFQANSRVITTTDQMLEELVNLKR